MIRIKHLLDPLVTVWGVLSVTALLVILNPILFGSKYSGVPLVTAHSAKWIIIFALSFSVAALIARVSHVKQARLFRNLDNSARTDSTRHLVEFFEVTHRWVWAVSLLSLSNALFRWFLSIQSIGGIPNAVDLIIRDSTLWRIQHVIYLNYWNGFFLPSELTPALAVYSLTGLALLWKLTWSSSPTSIQDVSGSSLDDVRKSLSQTIVLTFLTSILVSLLVRDRLTLLGTLIPSFCSASILVTRSLGTSGFLEFWKNYRWPALAVIISTVGIAVTNFAMRGPRSTVGELLSLDYFVTNLANTTFHITSVTQYGLGSYSLREFFYVLTLPVPITVQYFSGYLNSYEYSIVFNQAPSVWSHAWADFGPFGILYTFPLGFVSSNLYYQAWEESSFLSLGVGSLIASTWILSFHAFQLVLVEFWWNLLFIILIGRIGEMLRVRRRVGSKLSTVA